MPVLAILQFLHHCQPLIFHTSSARRRQKIHQTTPKPSHHHERRPHDVRAVRCGQQHWRRPPRVHRRRTRWGEAFDIVISFCVNEYVPIITYWCVLFVDEYLPLTHDLPLPPSSFFTSFAVHRQSRQRHRLLLSHLCWVSWHHRLVYATIIDPTAINPTYHCIKVGRTSILLQYDERMQK